MKFCDCAFSGNHRMHLEYKACSKKFLCQYKVISFRCTNGDFYVALGSSKCLALLVWVGKWSVKAGFILLL